MVRTTLCMALALLFCNANTTNAQLTDNFDSYPVGDELFQNGWEGWGGVTAAAGRVSNAQAFSAPNSLALEFNDDAINPMGTPNSGCWEFTCQMYIPSGTTGMPYFIMLNDYDPACLMCVWSVQIQFDAENGLFFDDFNPTMACTEMLFDQWFEIRVVMDFDNDVMSQWVDGQQLGAAGQTWSDRSGTAGAAELSILDLFSNGASTFFVDDVNFVSTTTCDLGPGAPTTAGADTTQVFRGIQTSGSDADMTMSDDTAATFNPGFTINNTEAPVWMIYEANINPFLADFIVESNAGTPGLSYTVELFDYVLGDWEEVAVESETFNMDSVTVHTLINNPGVQDHFNFDVDGDGNADFPFCPQVRSRVGWRQTGFTINFPWEVRIDQAGWQLTVNPPPAP